MTKRKTKYTFGTVFRYQKVAECYLPRGLVPDYHSTQQEQAVPKQLLFSGPIFFLYHLNTQVTLTFVYFLCDGKVQLFI